MISAEEAKRNRELCRKYPFLLPYEALIETDDGDCLPKTDTVSPDFDYSYTMLDFVPSGWQNLFLEMCEEIRQKLTGTDRVDTTVFSTEIAIRGFFIPVVTNPGKGGDK